MSELETVFGEMDQLAERLEEVAFFALDEYAGEKVEELQEKLSVPWPPSSTEGEYPRKRTGRLREGVYNVTLREGENINSSIFSSRPGDPPGVPGRLEYGLDRPYMRYTYRSIQEDFRDRIFTKIKERLPGL